MNLCAQTRVCQRAHCWAVQKRVARLPGRSNSAMSLAVFFALLKDRLSWEEFLGLLYLRNIAWQVCEDKLSRSIKCRCAGAKLACMYQINASAVAQFDLRLRCLQQGCHTRLKRNQRTSQALSGDVLRDEHCSQVGVGAKVGAGKAHLCRSRHSNIVGNPTSPPPCRIRTGWNGQPAVGQISCYVPTNFLLS